MVSRRTQSAALLALVVLGELYVVVTTPRAWGALAAGVAFAMLLGSLFIRSPCVLAIASWSCRCGLLASAAAVMVGVVGYVSYNADLAVYLPIGVTYGIILCISLMGIKDAQRRTRHGKDRVMRTM